MVKSASTSDYNFSPKVMRGDLAIGVCVSCLCIFGSAALSQWLKNGPPKVKVKAEEHQIQLVMPPPEPDETPVEENQQTSAPADIAPPQQQDVPSIPNPDSFVVKVEPPPPEGLHADVVAISAPVGVGFKKGEQIFDQSMLDQQIVATFQPGANYPYDMKKQGISGKATVRFVVDADGHVRPGSAYAVSSTQREFESPAIQAVSKWRFRPGRRGGQAVPSLAEITFSFNLGDE
jgi:protein TonB